MFHSRQRLIALLIGFIVLAIGLISGVSVLSNNNTPPVLPTQLLLENSEVTEPVSVVEMSTSAAETEVFSTATEEITETIIEPTATAVVTATPISVTEEVQEVTAESPTATPNIPSTTSIVITPIVNPTPSQTPGSQPNPTSVDNESNGGTNAGGNGNGGNNSQKINPNVYAEIQTRGFAEVVVNLSAVMPANATQNLTSYHTALSQAQQNLLTQLGLSSQDILYTYDNIPAMAVRIRQQHLNTLSANGLVSNVQLDDPIRAMTGETLPLIGISSAHANGLTGAGTRVAILDTGIDETNGAFGNQVIRRVCVLQRCPQNPTSVHDRNGHGTNIAGIIHSIAPNAELVIIKVLDDNGSGTYSNWLSGLDYLVEHQAELQINVVNLSIGTGALYTGECDSIYETATSALHFLKQSNVTIFSASGNQGSLNSLAAPSCLRPVVSVASSYDATTAQQSDIGDFSEMHEPFAACSETVTDVNMITCFSNRSSNLDLVAPGSILSVHLGDTVYTSSGTSQASAVAAGSALLVIQANPYLLPNQVERILEQTGYLIDDTAAGITKPRIQVDTAITRAQQTVFNCAEVDTIDSGECASLVVLYNNLGGPEWVRADGWLKQPDPCDWYGIDCSNGHVTSLRLPQNHLAGTLPNEIGQLGHLREFRVNGNILSGEIPASFLNLQRLSGLNLSYNELISSNSELTERLSTLQGTWARTQTIYPSNVNVLALSHTSIRVMWSKILYQGDTGHYTVECGTNAGGPYDVLQATTTSKRNTYVDFNVQADTTYFCHVSTTTEAHTRNPNTLVSTWSPEDSVSTTDAGLRNQVLTFTPVIDTFVAQYATSYRNDGRRMLLVGSYTDYALPDDPFFGFTRSLLDFDTSSLESSMRFQSANLHLWYYSTNAGYENTVNIYGVNDPWDGTVIYPGPVAGEQFGSGDFPDWDSDSLPLEIAIPLDSTILNYLSQPNNGLMFKSANENAPGIAICSSNLDDLCTSNRVPTLEIIFDANETPVAINPQPANLSTNVELPPKLAWEADFDPEGDVLVFDVYSGTSANALTLRAENLTEPEYTLDVNTYGTQIFWRVDIRDAMGGVRTGDVWSFWTPACDPGAANAGECSILVDFFLGNQGGDWQNNGNWLHNSDICSWYGVICDQGFVTKLELPLNNLHGDYLSGLVGLSHLQVLNLSDNRLTGQLGDIGLLTELIELDLSNNRVYGQLQPTISGATSLTRLLLDNNRLSGELPTALFTLSSLQTLDLGSNDFSGELSTDIGQLANLSLLDLHGNRFDGMLPTTIGRLTQLEQLDLSLNAFYGDIPASIESLAENVTADFGYNALTNHPSLSSNNTYTNTLQVVDGLNPAWRSTQTVAPINLHVDSVGENSITLSWNQVDFMDDGYYQVICGLDLTTGNYQSLQFQKTDNKTTVQFVFSPLYPGQEYKCAVGTVTNPNPTIGQKNILVSLLSPLVTATTLPSSDQGASWLTAIPIEQLPFYQVFEPFAGKDPADPNPSCLTGGGGYVRMTWGSGDTQVVRLITSSDTDSATALVVLTKDENGDFIEVTCMLGTDGTSGAGSQTQQGTSSGMTVLDFTAQPNTTYYIMAVDIRHRANYLTFSMQSLQFTGCADAIGVPQDECDKLVNLYNETEGYAWTHRDGWITDADVCQWYGVVCRDGHVVGLHFPNNNLTGRINSRVFNLPALEALDLSFNYLSGSIPDSILDLTSLENLDLSYNLLFADSDDVAAFVSAKQPLWSSTQTIAPNFTAEAGDFTNIAVRWVPIEYLSSPGWYEVGYSTQSGGPYEWVVVPGDKTTNHMLLTEPLLGNTTYYIVMRTHSEESIFQPRSLTSERGPEVMVTTGEEQPSTLIARDDAWTINKNASFHFNVLTNDESLVGTPFEIISISAPQHGEVSTEGVGDLVYKPENNYLGLDQFTYTIRDLNGFEATAIVSMTIEEQPIATNTAPVLREDNYTIQSGDRVILNVLDNDQDPDSDQLMVIEVGTPLFGQVNIRPNQQRLEYETSSGVSGTDQFTYTVDDGYGHLVTAYVNVVITPITEVAPVETETMTPPTEITPVESEPPTPPTETPTETPEPDQDTLAGYVIHCVTQEGQRNELLGHIEDGRWEQFIEQVAKLNDEWMIQDQPLTCPANLREIMREWGEYFLNQQ